MNKAAFEMLIAEALDTLPETFAKALDNVEIVAADWPTQQDLIDGHVPASLTLFGLYHGVPKTKRGNYSGVAPDTITIFAGPIRIIYGENPDAIRKQVRNTVLHEIGHHFGMTEEEIRKAQRSRT
ncbi:MAG TPA: metallopeptidase family protein [Patescibacteria group bacterium]|nr:metallopeptidase family protein [Patescibacteria group bacterium]